MPGTKLTADAHGRLTVPNDPIVPVVEGDGVGALVWRQTRAVLEAAVAAAYGGRRRLHFLELPAGDRSWRELRTRAPEATVSAFRMYRVGLVGAMRETSLADELREVLDLFVSSARPMPELLLIRDERERGATRLELASGSAAGVIAVDALQAGAPDPLQEQAFGTVAKADADRARRGDLPTGQLEVALAFHDVSAEGTRRLAAAAARIAQSSGFERVGFVGDAGRMPKLALAEHEWIGSALDAVSTDEALRAVFANAPESKAFCASRDVTEWMFDALGPTLAGRPYVTSLQNPETGHAIFAPSSDSAAVDGDGRQASVAPLLGAATALLRHLGWTEAAEAIDAALADATKAGLEGPRVGDEVVRILRA